MASVIVVSRALSRAPPKRLSSEPAPLQSPLLCTNFRTSPSRAARASRRALRLSRRESTVTNGLLVWLTSTTYGRLCSTVKVELESRGSISTLGGGLGGAEGGGLGGGEG